MKRFISLAVAMAIVISLSACSGKKEETGNSTSPAGQSESKSSETSTTKDGLQFTQGFNEVASKSLDNLSEATAKVDSQDQMKSLEISMGVPMNLLEMIMSEIPLAVAKAKDNGQYDFVYENIAGLNQYKNLKLTKSGSAYAFEAEGVSTANKTAFSMSVRYDENRDSFYEEYKTYDESGKVEGRHIHEFIKSSDGYYTQSYKYDPAMPDKLTIYKCYLSGTESKIAVQKMSSASIDFKVPSSIFDKSPSGWNQFKSDISASYEASWTSSGLTFLK